MSVPPPLSIPSSLRPYFEQLTLPAPDSHKGQNGKLLIIGGSELFHAASKWSLDIASKCVDMVFYSSIPDNNELIKIAKGEFWNGIVIARSEIENYLKEADAVLIGPGMTRSEETASLTNDLLRHFPNKKWVIDAGALQMIDVELLNPNCIITPHQGELEILKSKQANLDEVTVLVKGQTDEVRQGTMKLEITGGNAGMTKGGTGDVLAGLVAALYTRHDALTAAVVGSYVNKAAGDALYEQVGPYFNASDLVEEIPRVLWKLQKAMKQKYDN